MRSFLIVIAAGLVISAMPAAAQTKMAAVPGENASSEQRAPQGNSASSSADTRRICVNVETTGSRMVRRVCRTQAEWDARGGLEDGHE